MPLYKTGDTYNASLVKEGEDTQEIANQQEQSKEILEEKAEEEKENE